MSKRTLISISLAIVLLLSGTTVLAQIKPATKAAPTVAPTEPPKPTSTPAPAVAPETEAAEPESAMQVTVYNQNIGLIKEIRTLDLDEGVNEVRFTDVPSAIDPTSVHFESLTAPETAVLEQNFEYDIVGSSKLLSKYVDREITLITEQGETYQGTLLSAADDLILATADGLKMVRADKVLEYSFPTLPEGLITRPTLVWLLQAPQAGKQDVRVTYLTNDITWQADYVALLAPDDQSLSLTGWVTVDNRSGATYKDAKLKLVAGDINIAAAQPKAMAEEQLVYATAAPQVQEREFFEYHLYEVQRPVTIKDQQTKQIEFVTAPEVAAEKVFVLPGGSYAWWGSPYLDAGYPNEGTVKAQVQVRLVNDQESGLGVPLPKGRVRVYQADVDGGSELVGEDTIDHTPRDEKVSLTVGSAFDVVGERTQVEFKQLDEREAQETIRVVVRNHKTEDIQVHVVENLFRAQDATVTEATADYTALNAQTIEFVLDVAADGEAEVTYSVLYRW